jgi:hypothetical protein
LIINQIHLRRVMREYVDSFNTARPHQGIEKRIPVPRLTHKSTGPVRRRTVLGGIIRDYYRDATLGEISYCTNFLRQRVKFLPQINF